MIRTCEIDGCLGKHKSRGWCIAHYTRWKRYGDPLGKARRPTIEERLSYTITETGCWEFTGAPDADGYGRMRVGGRDLRAHRVAFEFWAGPIPTYLHVLHRCDNPPCVNPEHLFVGTHQDNMDDSRAKGRSIRGERDGNSKLTESQVINIRADPRVHREIAADYDIDRATVGYIKRRERWAWLDYPANSE